MVNLDDAARSNGIELVGAERLPKGQNTVENVSRVISAARALEKAAQAEAQRFNDQKIELLNRLSGKDDKIVELEAELNLLRDDLVKTSAKLARYEQREKAEAAGLTIAQKRQLGLIDHSDTDE